MAGPKALRLINAITDEINALPKGDQKEAWNSACTALLEELREILPQEAHDQLFALMFAAMEVGKRHKRSTVQPVALELRLLDLVDHHGMSIANAMKRMAAEGDCSVDLIRKALDPPGTKLEKEDWLERMRAWKRSRDEIMASLKCRPRKSKD